jgi:hypothetical protein
MRTPRKPPRAGWLSATSVAVVAALAATTATASADDVGAQVVQEANGIATAGPTSVPYHHSGALLLDHFYFRDVNDDQHLKVLEALPSSAGRLFVAFSDQSRDEQFEYRVAHQRISSTGTIPGSLYRTGCHGYCRTKITVPPGDHVFVISGFSFLFADGDHHIDQISISESNGYLTHSFNDKNDDDEYSAVVDYVWVPRSHFSFFETLSATPGHQGQVTRGVAAGNKVIRGFSVQNVENGGEADNHIKRFGFLTHSTTVDIYYGDKDPTDSGYWRYDLSYAVLR